jgi:hypothetical protein
MANATDNTTRPKEDSSQGPTRKSLSQLLDAIGEESQVPDQGSLSPQVLAIVMEMRTTYERGYLSTKYAEWALGTLQEEQQLEALKVLQSMIGAANLRKIVLAQKPLTDADAQSDSAVISAYQRLVILNVQGRLTPDRVTEALNELPDPHQKKALSLSLQSILSSSGPLEIPED